MATGNLTLFDLATLQRNDSYTGLIEDVTTLAPEFSTIPAVARSGTWYEIVKRVALPTAQFRAVNSGITPGRSIYKKELKEMFFLDVALNMDEAIVKGDDASVGSVWTNEAVGAMQAASILIGAQTYYGVSADASGFVGFRNQLSYTVSAAGTTNSTSAYLAWMDPAHGVRFDVGRDGNFAISTPIRQQVADPLNSAKSYFAFVGNLSAYVGLAVCSNLAVWSVAGIDLTLASSIYTRALTDRNAGLLLSNIPAARRNNLRWFMNRTSHFLLQQSRTTIIPGGGVSYQGAGASGMPAWAPPPENLAGYPITVTDSITNTESN